MPLCAPWVEPDAISACAEGDFDPGVLDRAALASSELLYAASGRQFHGLCTDSVRPCSSSWAWWWAGRYEIDLAHAHLFGANPLLIGDCCGTTDDLVCGCQQHDTLRLPNTPVVEVTQILIDGDALADGSWTIVDDQWLVRRDDESWPCCQDLSEPATEDGTWQVTYSWGTAVPAAGQLAAEVLTCELAKAWSGKDCRLPRRVTSIVRENVSMAVLDPLDFLDQGRFGIYEVDVFVQTFNPGKLQRPSRLINPRRAEPRRVR